MQRPNRTDKVFGQHNGWVHLARYEGSEAWKLVGIEADVSCGKDEAPLAWATLAILNGGNKDAALAIYTSPLPPGYLNAIAPLISEHNTRSSVYLPLVAKGNMVTAPAAPEDNP